MFSIIIFYIRNIINAMSYFIWNTDKKPNIIITAVRAHEILKSPDYIRQKSNAWLINTLSIVNPFTINDESLRREFKNKVIKTLSEWSSERKHEELTSIIKDRIHYRVSLLQSNDNEFCLSKLVKEVTLDSFLSAILNVNATEDLLMELPDLIIHLWKNRDDKIAQHRLQELFSTNKDNFSQSEFWQQIQSILSNRSDIISTIARNDFDEKISNPLNIIVPGWETMWRVVFYALLELLRHPELLKELYTQLNDKSKSSQNCVLLKCILKETLRLYPPTKNIYRTHINTNESICISVQQIQRNEEVWGMDALNFRPDRFQEELTAEQKKHYLPFSISCPARHTFAYTFAGAIVTQILTQSDHLTVAQGSSLPSPDNLLELARNSYNDLRITM